MTSAADGPGYWTMAALLGTLSVGDCVKLCHRVVDGLCGKERPRVEDDSTAAHDRLHLLDFMTALFCLAVGQELSDEKMLSKLCEVDSSRAEAVLSVLRGRQEEVRSALLDRTHSLSSASLQDFDWQLALALSSDKTSSLHSPLLSLHLDVRDNGATQPVVIEMNREELGILISSLEAANKVVLQLK